LVQVVCGVSAGRGEEGSLHNVLEVGVAAGDILLVSRQVRAHEAHGAVVEAEADGHRALVAQHPHDAHSGAGAADVLYMG